MGVGNFFLLSQLTAFILSFILSFFIFIPMSINLKEFSGNCLLHATGRWENDSQVGSVDWGPNSACNFSVFMGIIIMMLTLFYGILYFLYLARDSDSSWLEAFITTIVAIVVTLMLFASAVTVSVGLKTWCDFLTGSSSQIVSCDLAEFIPFTRELAGINSSNFYSEMKMVEFGSWTSFLCWLFLAITSVVKIIKFQQHETFMSSMNRERQRLLQKVGHGENYNV
ncbi:transmembrane protein 179-like [Ruditapes philippinarum]|uniref:transmembrane protein 179-like n=1 Tax=Ruditapes philippinarum TaxID=129788 RepID=UPI00295B6BAE|nr:transmembrane protein 179-like [Ruditapes philippinarum]